MSIVLERISKSFGGHVIVDDFSLEIADGELFVLLGASGSGKSTILRIIAGLTPADRGRVMLHERDVTGLSPQARDIGLVFQNYSIFRHMTVAENIEFGLKLRKTPREERIHRRLELLDLVGLGGLGDRLPSQLSGGQQQRVALARALAYRPKVLLLDEPFGALDVKIRSQLRRNLRQIQQKLGVTTIMVTHDQEEAFELADRIGVIEKGRLLEVGPGEELYLRPRTSFVATFLGGGTVVVGTVRGGRAHFGRLVLPLAADWAAEENTRVQLLIRPEQVELCSQAPNGGETCLGQAEVLEETFTGSMRKLRLRLPRLRGTRQISPAPPFGEDGLLVDALLGASDLDIGRAPFAVVKGYHVLKAPPLRLLVVAPPGQGCTHPPVFVRWTVEKLEGTGTCLSFGGAEKPSEEGPPNGRTEQPRGSEMEMRSRQGDYVEGVLAELERTLYDVVVLVLKDHGQGTAIPGESLELIDVLLKVGELPILIVKGDFSQITRMMICTRGGEPGKHDVRDGGRLARRLRVPVELFHVATSGASSIAPAKAHLDRAAATLRSLDLEVSVRLGEAESAAPAILEEAGRSNSELIVVGGPLPRSRFFRGEDVTRQVIKGSDRPVLVIPVEEKSVGIPDTSGVASVTS